VDTTYTRCPLVKFVVHCGNCQESHAPMPAHSWTSRTPGPRAAAPHTNQVTSAPRAGGPPACSEVGSHLLPPAFKASTKTIRNRKREKEQWVEGLKGALCVSCSHGHGPPAPVLLEPPAGCHFGLHYAGRDRWRCPVAVASYCCCLLWC
jgi:hypothetical protein